MLRRVASIAPRFAAVRHASTGLGGEGLHAQAQRKIAKAAYVDVHSRTLDCHTNGAFRKETLDSIDVAEAKVLLKDYAASLNEAFGPEGLPTTQALAQLAKLELTDPSVYKADLMATAETETAYLENVKRSKKNLEGIIGELKEDKVRMTGTFADSFAPHYAPEGKETLVTQGKGGTERRRVLFTPWNSRGMDGGSIEDLINRYSKDVADMAADIEKRGATIAALKQQAANYAGEVEKAKAKVVACVGKLRESTGQLAAAHPPSTGIAPNSARDFLEGRDSNGLAVTRAGYGVYGALTAR